MVFGPEDQPGPIEPGKRFVFTNDLRLDRYDDSTPGNGLPSNADDRRAGTHSGVETIVRVASGTKRKIYTGSEGARILALGGTPNQAYDAPEFSQLGAPDPLAQQQQ